MAQSPIESHLDIAGFWDLRFADQLLIRRLLAGETAAADPQGAGGSGNGSRAPPPPAALPADQAAIRDYNDRVYAAADALRLADAGLLRAALEANGQELPQVRGGYDAAALRQLADMLVGGAPAPCPRCGGRVRYADGRYRCTGWVDAYARCQFRAAAHTRRPFDLPPQKRAAGFNLSSVARVRSPDATAHMARRTASFRIARAHAKMWYSRTRKCGTADLLVNRGTRGCLYAMPPPVRPPLRRLGAGASAGKGAGAGAGVIVGVGVGVGVGLQSVNGCVGVCSRAHAQRRAFARLACESVSVFLCACACVCARGRGW